MILYGPQNETTIIFEPILNLFINTIFTMISLVLIFMGYIHMMYPLLLFILSIVMCHLSDVLVKIFKVIQVNKYKTINISYFLALASFLAWYIGSYILIMNIIINYAILVLLFCCLVTFLYGAILIIYFSALANLTYAHFMSPNCYYR
jgi:hypothetical protein